MSLFRSLIMAKKRQHKLPTEGLVFHASLNGQTPAVAETGQEIVSHGTESYGVVDGVPCLMHTTNVNQWLSSDGSYPLSTGAYTLSAWVRHSRSTLGYNTVWCFGLTDKTSYGKCMQIGVITSNSFMLLRGGGTGDCAFSTDTTQNRWRCLVVIVDFASDTISGYVDGMFIKGISSYTSYYKKAYSQIRFCTDYNGDARGKNGTYDLAACRIYDRALTQDEITALAGEFTPTAS